MGSHQIESLTGKSAVERVRQIIPGQSAHLQVLGYVLRVVGVRYRSAEIVETDTLTVNNRIRINIIDYCDYSRLAND